MLSRVPRAIVFRAVNTRRHIYYVYILCNHRNGTLYVGVTNNIHERLCEHRAGKSRFTARYGVRRLVYLESFQYVNDAIAFEKRLKKYPRQWKINLIEARNPEWSELELHPFD